MDNYPPKDQSFATYVLREWPFAREPVEVVVPENQPAAPADDIPRRVSMPQPEAKPRESPETRPTTDEMMSAMRALRRRRASAPEDEIVIDDILADNSPSSLRADIRRASGGAPEHPGE